MARKRVTRVHGIETERPPHPSGYVHTSVCIASARTNNSLPTSVRLSVPLRLRADTTFAQTLPR